MRQIDGNLGSVRAQLMDTFSESLGSTKETTWDALANVRERLDNLEVLVETSNGEIVNVLNKKAYKDDVTRAISSKADKETVLNSIRLKVRREKRRAERGVK